MVGRCGARGLGVRNLAEGGSSFVIVIASILRRVWGGRARCRSVRRESVRMSYITTPSLIGRIGRNVVLRVAMARTPFILLPSTLSIMKVQPSSKRHMISILLKLTQ